MVRLFLHAGKVSWFKNPAQALIALGTDSRYTHVGIEYDKRLIIESTTERGVDIRPISHYRDKVMNEKVRIDIYECLEAINEREFFDWLVNQEGRKYDFKAILFLAWLKISVQRDKANQFQRDKDYFCSELAMVGLRMFALNKEKAFKDLPNDNIISPADISRSKSFHLANTISKFG